MPKMDGLTPSPGGRLRPQNQDCYTLRIGLPGVAKEDIMVAVVDGCIEVHGRARLERTEESPGEEYYELEEMVAHHRVPLPADAELAEVRVSLADGEVMVEVPRRKPGGF
ncbi:MAG: Hsp20/alpha crystallin family protein [Patescibacteria group bacterium]